MESINVTASKDLDRKINAILSIIVQDDGDSLAKRAEMYYEKRPELIHMVEDLHKSYRSLADKYDQLRSEVKRDSHPRSLLSLTSSVNQVHGLQNYVERLEGKELSGQSNFHSKSSAAEDPDHETESDDEYIPADSCKNTKMKPDDGSQEKKNIDGSGFQRNTSDDSRAAMLENEKLWNELRLKVSELVEDNLSHQAELIKRNDEKRETIRDLSSKMNMVQEHAVRGVKSKSSLVTHKLPKKNQSQFSRLKRLFLGRFMK
ncbi:protein NETWORKED 3A-like isoform X2 [Herrania umbratica]|uniref:Protein NETWORKED 3A-like isoform X2 n=1 Tax=Herrania umbratica TaxID=108875 RepID=A0A6J1AU49_9ROSI|nr:protein NETWORKED 3A-like isoform X2 [Herrania umbratica]